MSVSKLKARTVPVARLSPAATARMFRLMKAYYDAITEEQFRIDLAKKDVVILLEADGAIQGFSTLVVRAMECEGRTFRGAFSGDTILERKYWGQAALGKAFLKHLWLQKLRHPLTPLYWFLISKGYKTYLMMANNFTEYFPRHDRETPAWAKARMDRFYGELFAGDYDPASGLILFEVAPCKLKQEVAPIDQSMMEANPKIRFFHERNPGWRSGNELACMSSMTALMPLKYSPKTLGKSLLGLASRLLPAPSREPKPIPLESSPRRDPSREAV